MAIQPAKVDLAASPDPRGVLELVRALRAANRALDRLLERLDHFGDWAVVGGAARGWVLREGRPRDLDLVARTRSVSLEAVLESLVCWPETRGVVARRNSMGGYKLALGSIEVDVWSADATFNVQRGIVRHRWSYQAVALAGPLSCDTLVVSRSGGVFQHRFFECLRHRVVALHHPHVRHGDKLADKAIRLCREHRLTPDLLLAGLIVAHRGRDALRAIATQCAATRRDASSIQRSERPVENRREKRRGTGQTACAGTPAVASWSNTARVTGLGPMG